MTSNEEVESTASTSLDPLFDPKAQKVTLRAVDLDELAPLLRAAMGLPPDQIRMGERAAAYRRFLPREVPYVDVDGWIAWALVGLPLFVTGLPKIRQAWGAASSIVIVLAMVRTGGHLTRAADSIGFTRKSMRVTLQRQGLYPWPTSGSRRSPMRESAVIGEAWKALAHLRTLEQFTEGLDAEVLADAALVLTRWLRKLTRKHL